MLFRRILHIFLIITVTHLSSPAYSCPPRKLLDGMTKEYYDVNSQALAENFKNHTADDTAFKFFTSAIKGDGQKVLDIGTRTGRFAAKLLQNGHEVTAVDSSDTLLRTAKTEYPGANYVNMDARNLDFADNSFDATSAAYSFSHFNKADMEKAVQEQIRVTKEDGKIFIALQKQSGTNVETAMEPLKRLTGFNDRALPVLRVTEKDAIRILEENGVVIDEVSSRPARLDLNELSPDKMYFIGTKAKDLNTRIDLLAEASEDIMLQINRVIQDSGKTELGNIKFPQILRQKQNRNIQALLRILQNSGVNARYNISRKYPEFLEIEILGVTDEAPEAIKNYFKRYQDLKGTELVISPFENALGLAKSRFYSPTNTVDIGMDSLVNALKGKEHRQAHHELDHLMLTKKQEIETDQFSVKFYGNKRSLRIDESDRAPADSFYSEYENAQEVYTFSKELEFLGNQLKQATSPKDKIELVKEIRQTVREYNEIMQRTLNLAQSGKFSKSKPRLISIQDSTKKAILIKDTEGRDMTLELTKAELEVYNGVKEENLLKLLTPQQVSVYKAKRDELKQKPFFARTGTEHIRSTLLNMIQDKMVNHLGELSATTQNQAMLGNQIQSTMNSSTLDTKKLSDLLIKAGKNVEI